MRIIKGIATLILIFVMALCASNTSSARMIKQFVGDMICTTYHVSDNTPKGTRATATGAVAQEYHTIAVDGRNPRFPIGTRLYVEGFGWGIVEDVGGFGKYGVSLDLFTPENVGFKKPCKVWVYRKETKKEKQKRLAKIRRKRQKKPFRIIFSDDYPDGTAIVDPDYIKKGSTVVFGMKHYEVVSTKKGMGNRVIFGTANPLYDWKDFKEVNWALKEFKLTDVIENVKG